MLVQVALIAVALCGMLSLIIDVGYARVTQGQMRRHRQALGAKDPGSVFQIGPVGLHLFGFWQLELVEIARHRAVGHVRQQQMRLQL